MSKHRGNGEGSVYREVKPSRNPDSPPTIRWVAQVRIDGEKRRATGKTEAEAKRKLRTMVAAIEAGNRITDGNMTLGDLLDNWRSKVLPSRGLSPRTIVSYNWACDVLMQDLGTVRLRKLTVERIEAAFERRAVNGVSRASLVKIRSVLGAALAYAQRRTVIPSNPARIAELPAEARRTPEGRALTIEQAQALIQVAEQGRLNALWCVMLYMGLRPGEATGLTWGDFDMANAVVHVRRSLKVEHNRLVIDEQLKTAKSRRSLEVPQPVVRALAKHREGQRREAQIAGSAWNNELDLIFTTTAGTPINPSNHRRAFRELSESAGLGRWHPHELRHTAASLLSAAGVPLEQVADVLGHDGTRMTALVYRHATSPTIAASTRLGDVLAS